MKLQEKNGGEIEVAGDKTDGGSGLKGGGWGRPSRRWYSRSLSLSQALSLSNSNSEMKKEVEGFKTLSDGIFRQNSINCNV